MFLFFSNKVIFFVCFLIMILGFVNSFFWLVGIVLSCVIRGFGRIGRRKEFVFLVLGCFCF